MYGGSEQDEKEQNTESNENSRSVLPQNWTVHAEFTISHDGPAEQGIGPPIAHTEQDENGAVKLVYRWTSVQTHPTVDEQCNTKLSTDTQPSNFLFTSTPPKKQTSKQNAGGYVRNILNKFAASKDTQQQQHGISSGYSSEQLMSPNGNSNSIHNGNNQRFIQPYNRRCKSTCSIVLSSNIGAAVGSTALTPVSASRSHSLRCQTPTTCLQTTANADAPLPLIKGSTFYGCGDPWCYHSPNYDENLTIFPPLIEADEYTTAPTASMKSTATTHNYSLLSTHNYRHCKDASVQTYEMVDKCTSPFLFSDLQSKKDETSSSGVVSGKLNLGVIGPPKKRPGYLTRRKTEPIRRPSRSRDTDLSISPDLKMQHQNTRILQQGQDIKPSTLLNKEVRSEDSNKFLNLADRSLADKKPRTVHIDVYCTGTEQESSSASSSSSDDLANNYEIEQVSSPQTVYESSDVRISHVRADSKALPQRIAVETSATNQEDNDDQTSTAYPSRLSSYSAIRDFDLSSFSTNPWSRMSLSSCDTAASWKDNTASDLTSLCEGSRFSTDHSLFGSRSRQLCSVGESIREEDAIIRNTAQTPSSFDSFEYAASEDKARIRKLNEELVRWKSPQIERQMLLKKSSVLDELNRLLSSSDDDSTDSDQSEHSGKGWSFVKTCNLEREDTVKQRCFLKPAPQVISKSPSILIVKQKLIENPQLGAPFTQSPGIFTEQRQIARRFGKIIDAYKKPGHHIGPSKNPDCSCNHCTEYFRCGFGRGRTQSVGNSGAGMDYYRWKRGNDGGRGSEPPQSRQETKLQLDKEALLHGLTRNASLSNM